MRFQGHAPFKRQRGACSYSSYHNFDYAHKKSKSFKRRKPSHRPWMPHFQPPNEAFTHDQNGSADMQTPTSPKVTKTTTTTPRDDSANDAAKRQMNVPTTHSTDLVNTKPRSSPASSLAAISLPLPEDVEELKLRFLSMCSTLVTYSEGRTALIKKNERLQTENDGLGNELREAQQKNVQLQKDLVDTQVRWKQSDIKREQEAKALRGDCARLEEEKSQLDTDLKAAKQQVEINKNRYELELRKQGEHSKNLQKLNAEINEKNGTIDALRKDVTSHNKAWQEKQRRIDELTKTSAQTDDRLQQSLGHLRLAIQTARTAQANLPYAQHSLLSEQDESDEYAFANILVLGQDACRAASVREQAMRAQFKLLQDKLETSESDMARLKTEKAQLDEKLVAAAKVAETNTNTENSSRNSINTELAKLRDDQKELKKKYETARTEITTLTSRCEDLGNRLAKANSENNSLNKLRDEQKDLEQKYETARTQVTTLTRRCEDLKGRLVKADTEKDALTKEKQGLMDRNGKLEEQKDSAERQAKIQTAGLKSELDVAKSEAADAAKQSKVQRHPTQRYTSLDDVEFIFEDKLSIPARMREIYREDSKQQVEIRVDGKILPHPFVVPENRKADDVDTHHLSDGPLVEGNTPPEEEVSSRKPWVLTPIAYNPAELEDIVKPNRYDLFKLPLEEGQDDELAIMPEEAVEKGDAANSMVVMAAQLPAEDPARHLSIGAPPVAEFMQGAHIVRTRESNAGLLFADEPTVSEDATKKSPTTLKGAGIQRIEIPKLQPQVNNSSAPTSSVQGSPRDSVLMTPRSPGEGDAPQRRPLKRFAPQDTNGDPATDPRSPKRHAPSDPVRHAPKQPRNYDARREYQQDRSNRAPPPGGHSRSSGGPREYDSYKPGRDPRGRDPRDRDYDREKERQRTEGCWQRRWND